MQFFLPEPQLEGLSWSQVRKKMEPEERSGNIHMMGNRRVKTSGVSLFSLFRGGFIRREMGGDEGAAKTTKRHVGGGERGGGFPPPNYAKHCNGWVFFFSDR